jgi:hypothetical protein
MMIYILMSPEISYAVLAHRDLAATNNYHPLSSDLQPTRNRGRSMSLPLRLALMVMLSLDGAITPAFAAEDADDNGPTLTPLTVGALQIASDSQLAVEAAAVTIASDLITYEYRLANKGSVALDLSASVAMPDLETSADGAEIYALPAPSPDNPVNLTVKSNQKPVATTATIAAIALGLDRLAELKVEHIPLVPFGADTEKALAAAKPDTIAKLAALGLISPPVPAQPDSPVVADWRLQVTHSWTQHLDPSTTTSLTVSFAPIKATYVVDKETLAGFDALKDQICLTPKIAATLKGMLKTKTATLEATDIVVATDKPARWIDSPAMTIAVRKPQAASVVVFCGQDVATASQPIVKGTTADDSDAALRVIIFTPGGP